MAYSCCKLLSCSRLPELANSREKDRPGTPVVVSLTVTSSIEDPQKVQERMRLTGPVPRLRQRARTGLSFFTNQKLSVVLPSGKRAFFPLSIDQLSVDVGDGHLREPL